MIRLFVFFIFFSGPLLAQKTNLNVADFEKGIQQSNVQILDVRTTGEYQSGHLAKAFLADWTNRNEFKTRVAALDKSKPVYAYCLSGIRSREAAEWLRASGFTAYNLSGGINAWKRENKTVEAAVRVPQMSLQDYQALIPTNQTVLVDISAEWCPPCKKMAPVIAALEQKYRTRIKVVRIDGGQQTALANALQIEAFPGLIIYKNGKPVWQAQGLVTQEEIERHL